MKKLIFIGGVPRSGTTLLQRVLSEHPKIITGQELGLFDGYYFSLQHRYLEDSISERGSLGLGAYFEEHEVRDLLYSFMRKIMQEINKKFPDNNSSYFLEKTPSNIIFVREILECFPEAVFIEIKRNKISNALSIYKAANSWGKIWAPKSPSGIKKMIDQHSINSDQTLEYLATSRFMTINYEDLTNDHIKTLKNIFDFLELEINTKEINDLYLSQYNRLNTNIPILQKGKFINHKEPHGFISKKNPFFDKIAKLLFKIFFKIIS